MNDIERRKKDKDSPELRHWKMQSAAEFLSERVRSGLMEGGRMRSEWCGVLHLPVPGMGNRLTRYSSVIHPDSGFSRPNGICGRTKKGLAA